MAAQEDQQVIEQLGIVARAQQWDLVTVDRSGPTILVTFEHVKPLPRTPPTPQK